MSYGRSLNTIKASCPSHGVVEMGPSDVALYTFTNHDMDYYVFYCDDCNGPVEKPAGRDVVSLLRSGGVIPIHTDIPLEILERIDMCAPAFTSDDLLDFLIELNNWAPDLIANAAQQG